jgi:hypothetical protein
MAVSCHRNAGQNHSLLTANKSFQNVTKFGYLGAAVINQNCVHEEIKSRLNSGNACYSSVQSLFCSHLLCKKYTETFHLLSWIGVKLYLPH